MSNPVIPDGVERLGSIIEDVFGRALVDEIAPAIANAWKGNIVALDVIDSRTYLNAVRVTDISGAPGEVIIEAPEAAGYAGAIKRKGDADYVGRRVAEEAPKAAEGEIKAALDRAGERLNG
jgi:hypothetical protein